MSRKFVLMSWRQKVHDDIKKFVKHVMTSKSSSWYQKYVMTSKSSSWRQKYIMTTKKFIMTSKTRHDSKSLWWRKNVMTSKTRHAVKSMSWRQKVRHDVKKLIMMSKTQYDIKKFVKRFVLTSKNFVNTSWIRQYVMKTSKSRHDVKQIVTSDRSSKQKHVMT